MPRRRFQAAAIGLFLAIAPRWVISAAAQDEVASPTPRTEAAARADAEQSNILDMDIEELGSVDVKSPAMDSTPGVVLISRTPAKAQDNSSPSAPHPDTEATADAGKSNILDMDIEQLSKVDVKVPAMDVEVTSVSKQESTVGHSPAAVFVITNDMIRRSGVTSIPEALRMAPGVEVARVNSHVWAITIRGFNAFFASKLLVLIDGRAVYTEFLSGVYWDVQDLPLEDVERIEVIRGPGGTIWGANAVNGVINIITKKAQDTQGALVSVGGGNLDKSINTVRVGGNNGDGLSWRIYGKQFERGAEYANPSAHDDWRMGRGGFRMDWELDRCKSNTLTVQGDYYGGQEGEQLYEAVPYPPYLSTTIDDEGVSGANVLGRFTHVIDDESDWSLLTYFDRTFRSSQSLFTQQMNTLDVEFQHRFPLGQRHHIIWGLCYRQVHSYLPNEIFAVTFIPHERTTNLFSPFIQDEIELVDERLFFTIGSKFEHNSFSGFEYQPSARLLLAFDRKHVAWAAISRAVRTPSLYDENVIQNMGPTEVPPLPPPTFYRIFGMTDLSAEDLVAYEIGYREQMTERFAWDIAAFYNVYDNQIWAFAPGDWFPEETYTVVPAYEENCARGHTYGVELTGQWSLSDTWRLTGSYSFLKLVLHSAPGTLDFENYEGNSPRNQVRLYSSWDLGDSWTLDLGFRYVDELTTGNIPAYLTMDLRLAWMPRKNVEVAVVGTNLFDNHHPEFSADQAYFQIAEVRRTIYASMTWRR